MCICVHVQVKKGGGMSINSTLTLTKMSERLAQLILHEYSIQIIYRGEGFEYPSSREGNRGEGV